MAARKGGHAAFPGPRTAREGVRPPYALAPAAYPARTPQAPRDTGTSPAAPAAPA